MAAGILFLVSAAGYAAVKLFLRPKEDLDEYYWEVRKSTPA